MARFENDREFNKFILESLGMSQNVIDYVDKNTSWLKDNLIGDIYAELSSSPDLEGVASDVLFEMAVSQLGEELSHLPPDSPLYQYSAVLMQDFEQNVLGQIDEDEQIELTDEYLEDTFRISLQDTYDIYSEGYSMFDKLTPEMRDKYKTPHQFALDYLYRQAKGEYDYKITRKDIADKWKIIKPTFKAEQDRIKAEQKMIKQNARAFARGAKHARVKTGRSSFGLKKIK